MKLNEFIPGTDVGSFYRVIAKKGRVRLGLKPAILPSNPVRIGWNVRAAVPLDEVGDTPVTVYEITSAFPKVHFHKKDNTRASKAQLIEIKASAPIHSPKTWLKAVENFATDKAALMKTVEGFLNKLDVDISEYGTDKQLADWYGEALLEGVAPMKAHLYPVNEDKIKVQVSNLLDGIFKSKPE